MPGHGETILVVEDDAEVRELVIGLMANLGYQTLAAENGADAIAIIEARPDIALLFTDVVLPGGMSGPDIARAAVALRPGLKVVFTSGYAQDALDRQTQSGQHVDLLQKPYRKADLARKIAGSLNS